MPHLFVVDPLGFKRAKAGTKPLGFAIETQSISRDPVLLRLAFIGAPLIFSGKNDRGLTLSTRAVGSIYRFVTFVGGRDARDRASVQRMKVRTRP